MARVACGWRRALRGAGLALAFVASAAWAGETTQYTYDALGRVVSAIDASGKKVSYTYDSAGNRTRVSNGAEFAEIIPTGWSSSSNAGTTGMTATNGLRDGAYAATSTIVATNVETGAWVKADLGSVQNVNHIAVTAAIESTTGATLADLNDTAVEYSTDGTTWATAATIEGVSPGASKSVTLGGVSLRYLRLHRLASGRVAFGDLRIYSAAAANTPLIANPDSITSTGSAVTFDPRTNDVDQDGYSITISTVDTPIHGTVVINSGVSLTYTPATGYIGADSFTYTVTDGHNGAASARVSVMVQSATNHAPVAVNDSFAIGDRVTSLVAGVAALKPMVNDYDPDGDPLTITGTSTPAHGTATVVGSSVINYQPTVAYDGSDSFTYNISDGRGGTSTATITVTTANSPPVANPDNITTSMNQAVKVDPRLNDSDPNGDAITVQSITQPGNGTAALNADQTVTYTPSAGVVGTDAFTYTLTDARGATATGLITVNALSNRPPVATPDSISATASTPVTFDPRANDTDPEGGGLTILSVGAPGHGSATVGGGGTAVTYTMAAGYAGQDSFTYTISDDQGLTATSTVWVNSLGGVDYLIVGGGGAGGTCYGTGGSGGQVVQGSGTSIPVGSIAVAVGAGGSASSTAGNAGGASSLGALSTASGGAGGAACQGNGGSGAGGAGASAIWTPQPGHAGRGGPGSSSSLSGTSVDYAAGGGGGGYDDGTEYDYAGPAGGPSAAAGGVEGYDPAPNAPANRGGGGGGGGMGPSGAGGSGIVILRYLGSPRATGGTITQVGGYTIHTFTTSGTLGVPAATSPTAVNDSLQAPSGLPVVFDPRTNDIDPNGLALSVVSVSAPAHGSAVRAANGQSITYTSTLGYIGSDSFTYTIGDGQGLTAAATVNVTVTGGLRVDYFVLGGGGGGGRGQNAGGGGGGQVATGTFLIASGAYAITVGAGGAGSTSWGSPGGNGSVSSLSALVAALGGGGGASESGNAPAPSTGSNGGGGSELARLGGGSASGGHIGGSALSGGLSAGAGGAGAGSDGQPGQAAYAGAGGAGIASSLSGTALTYGGGGGGGGIDDAPDGIYRWSAGASDGGGSGGYSPNAAPSKGGGGGGGGAYITTGGATYYSGGSGGSGVVIVRYPGTPVATGGAIAQVGGYTIHTFTSNGTFTVP